MHTANRSYLFQILLIMPFGLCVKAMQNALSPIEHALLIHEIEKKGVKSVRESMIEPKLAYDERNDIYYFSATVLTIETVLKQDESNPLATMIFAKIEEIEAGSDYQSAHRESKPYGKFWDLENSASTYYAWRGENGQRLPEIEVKARLCNKKAIKEVLNSYT